MTKVLLPIILALSTPLQAQVSKNSGISRAQADSRYVNVTGDTMTGTLNGLLSTWSAVRAGEATISGTMTVQGASGGYGLLVSSNVSLAGVVYTGAGKVGIGTVAPGSKLEVNGTSHFVGSMTVVANTFSVGGSTLVVNSGSVLVGASSILQNQDSNISGLYVIGASSTNERTALVISNGSGDSSTTNPSTALLFRTNSASNRKGAKIVGLREGIYDGASGADSALAFYTASNDTWSLGLYQNQLGNVGIGTTAPDSKLHVSSGTVKVDGNVEPGINVVGTLGLALGNDSVANFATSTPTKIGTIKYCADCSTVGVCVSTGIVQGAWALITDKAAACQ